MQPHLTLRAESRANTFDVKVVNLKRSLDIMDIIQNGTVHVFEKRKYNAPLHVIWQ